MVCGCLGEDSVLGMGKEHGELAASRSSPKSCALSVLKWLIEPSYQENRG